MYIYKKLHWIFRSVSEKIIMIFIDKPISLAVVEYSELESLQMIPQNFSKNLLCKLWKKKKRIKIDMQFLYIVLYYLLYYLM